MTPCVNEVDAEPAEAEPGDAVDPDAGLIPGRGDVPLHDRPNRPAEQGGPQDGGGEGH